MLLAAVHFRYRRPCQKRSSTCQLLAAYISQICLSRGLAVHRPGSAFRCIIRQGYRPFGVISVRLVVLIIILEVFFGVFLFFFNPIALIVSTAACQMSRILRYIHRT